MEKVAFAFRLAPERVELVDGLARSIMEDPGVDLISREMGMSCTIAWLQEGPVPLVVSYSEWKVDPVEGFEGLVGSPESGGDRIRDALRQVVKDPTDIALDAAAGRSELVLDWATPDGLRGSDLRCYARFVPRERAAAMSDFLRDLKEDRALMKVYSRLRERAGMKRISRWVEEVSPEEVLLIEMYESDDLDAAFANLAASQFDLDRHMESLALHSHGWSPAAMPKVRRIYQWSS